MLMLSEPLMLIVEVRQSARIIKSLGGYLAEWINDEIDDETQRFLFKSLTLSMSLAVYGIAIYLLRSVFLNSLSIFHVQ